MPKQRQLKKFTGLERIVSVRAVNVRSQEDADELFARFNRARRLAGCTTDIVPTGPPLIKED